MTSKAKTAGDKRRRKEVSEEDGGIEKSKMRPDMTSSSRRNKKTTDDDDGDGKETNVDGILNNFASDTSVPGIGNVYNAPSLIVRLFWILVVVLCVAMFIWGITELLQRYFGYPKKVTVELVSKPVPFPAVTICNMRGFDFDVMYTMHELLEFGPVGLDQLNRTLYNDPPFISEYIDFLRLFLPMWATKPDDPKTLKALKEAMSRTGLYAHILEINILQTAGIKAEQFIASCLMALEECNVTRDFTYLFNPYYINCYTHYDPESALGKSEKDLPWLMPGFDNGLSMVLLTGSGMIKEHVGKRFFPGIFNPDMPISGADGVRVIIHDPEQIPLPDAEGFDVPPGFSASFGIRPRLNKRIGRPHGNCRSGKLRMFGFNIPYRQFVCQQLCVQQYILDKCKCLDETLPIPFNTNFTVVKSCQNTEFFVPENCSSHPDAACFDGLLNYYEHIKCALRSRNEVRKNQSIVEDCDCRPNCEELLYDVSYSLSAWPADGFEGELAINDIMEVRNFTKAHFNERQQKLLHAEYDKDPLKFMRDFSKINVYISAPEVLVTRETAEYELPQLVSDIGGQQGIWLGLSLITAAEVVQFIGQIFYQVLINKRRHRR